MNTSFLMSYEEYNKRMGNYTIPHTFTIHNHNQALYYFGAKHSYDPTHTQFPALEKFWNNFLIETKKRNCVVLNEGGVRPMFKNAEEAILAGGEAHFITFLSAQHHIKTLSPEPHQAAERGELLKHFSPDNVQYYYFARAISQWHKHGGKINFETYIIPYLERDKRVSESPDFDFSLKNMKTIHRNLFSTTFDENDAEFFQKVTTPLSKATVINKVARMSGEIRDLFIVTEIKKLWETGKNIFVVYGHAHAIIQEPTLKKMLGN